MKIFQRILVLVLILFFAVESADSDFGNFSGNSGYSRSSSYSTRSSSSSNSSSSSRSSSSNSRPSTRTYTPSYSRPSRNSENSGGFNTIPIPFGVGTVQSHSNITSENPNDEEYNNDDDFDLSAALFFMLVIIVIYYFVIGKKKAKRERQVLLDENNFNFTNKIILEPIEEYSKLDPDFDENELASHLSNLYIQMQDAWSSKNLETLRPYFADVFYNQMDRALDDFRKNNKTDHTERIAVLAVNLKGFRQSKGTDYIIAGLTSRITTYITDDLTGKVISGDKNKELFMEYEFELSRKSGVITQHSHETKSDICPNCGAPININATAKCPYCGSIIKSQNINWVVSSMQGISQKSA